MIRSPIHERQDGDILVSTDETRLDLDTVHGFLAGSYWAVGIPREVVERSIRHSICFGAFDRGRQVGFREARHPDRLMERRQPQPYEAGAGNGAHGAKGEHTT